MGEIHAVMCFAYTNEIPKNVDELDKFSHDAFLQSAQRDQNVGQIAVAYTVWSKKKGGGKLIVKEVFKKYSNGEYDILVKNILYFFKKMNIKNVDESIIKKMIDINLNSINKIINATVEDFLNIENFKNKMATKVYENIQNAIKDVKLSQLMTATNLFGSGLGSKKLQLIINKIPDILNLKINKSNLADEVHISMHSFFL